MCTLEVKQQGFPAMCVSSNILKAKKHADIHNNRFIHLE